MTVATGFLLIGARCRDIATLVEQKLAGWKSADYRGHSFEGPGRVVDDPSVCSWTDYIPEGRVKSFCRAAACSIIRHDGHLALADDDRVDVLRRRGSKHCSLGRRWIRSTDANPDLAGRAL